MAEHVAQGPVRVVDVQQHVGVLQPRLAHPAQDLPAEKDEVPVEPQRVDFRQQVLHLGPEVRLEPDVVLKDDDFFVVVGDDVSPDVVVAHEAADLTVGDGPAVVRLLEFRHHGDSMFLEVVLIDVLQVTQMKS